jgi:hypothetical protein
MTACVSFNDDDDNDDNDDDDYDYYDENATKRSIPASYSVRPGFRPWPRGRYFGCLSSIPLG